MRLEPEQRVDRCVGLGIGARDRVVFLWEHKHLGVDAALLELVIVVDALRRRDAEILGADKQQHGGLHLVDIGDGRGLVHLDHDLLGRCAWGVVVFANCAVGPVWDIGDICHRGHVDHGIAQRRGLDAQPRALVADKMAREEPAVASAVEIEGLESVFRVLHHQIDALHAVVDILGAVLAAQREQIVDPESDRAAVVDLQHRVAVAEEECGRWAPFSRERGVRPAVRECNQLLCALGMEHECFAKLAAEQLRGDLGELGPARVEQGHTVEISRAVIDNRAVHGVWGGAGRAREEDVRFAADVGNIQGAHAAAELFLVERDRGAGLRIDEQCTCARAPDCVDKDAAAEDEARRKIGDVEPREGIVGVLAVRLMHEIDEHARLVGRRGAAEHAGEIDCAEPGSGEVGVADSWRVAAVEIDHDGAVRREARAACVPAALDGGEIEDSGGAARD
eukprot:comp20858_c0_seq1/m.43297 comp20858_c0_seq1/g.43297  ORF comp20858_c0_seq1/g.43297 comp20858_c0_seq1/m.43297 type:complete len:450 (+) comp20858_c0_seq1:35-1384(+)